MYVHNFVIKIIFRIIFNQSIYYFYLRQNAIYWKSKTTFFFLCYLKYIHIVNNITVYLKTYYKVSYTSIRKANFIGKTTPRYVPPTFRIENIAANGHWKLVKMSFVLTHQYSCDVTEVLNVLLVWFCFFMLPNRWIEDKLLYVLRFSFRARFSLKFIGMFRPNT